MFQSHMAPNRRTEAFSSLLVAYFICQPGWPAPNANELLLSRLLFNYDASIFQGVFRSITPLHWSFIRSSGDRPLCTPNARAILTPLAAFTLQRSFLCARPTRSLARSLSRNSSNGHVRHAARSKQRSASGSLEFRQFLFVSNPKFVVRPCR